LPAVSVLSGAAVPAAAAPPSSGTFPVLSHTTYAHGGNGGTPQELTLVAGEYLKSLTPHSAQRDGHTRVA
jgi:hypothetical protein